MKAKLLHTEEVAKVLGVSRRTASDLMRTMPCVNIGTSTTRPHLAVLEPDLDAWIPLLHCSMTGQRGTGMKNPRTGIIMMDGKQMTASRLVRR